VAPMAQRLQIGDSVAATSPQRHPVVDLVALVDKVAARGTPPQLARGHASFE